MKVTAVIAECNPLHQGHVYLLQKAREETGADHLLLLISGDYVQRGAPAIIHKYARCQALLSCGADAVLEMPVPYACGSADYFARGAVSLLDQLGVVDTLCFGSESGDMQALERSAALLQEESPAFQKILQEGLRSGLSYPAAKAAALSQDAPAGSNDLLATEYCKALQQRGSTICPHAILRTQAASASSLRQIMLPEDTADKTEGKTEEKAEEKKTGKRKTELEKELPPPMFALWQECLGKSAPVSADDFSWPLLYRLRMAGQPGQSLTDYLDVSPALAARIEKFLPEFTTYTDFCALVKSRNFTYTRISRALLHILLQLRRDDMEQWTAAGITGYARLLGFRKQAAPLLGAIKGNSSIPLISKLSTGSSLLTPPFSSMLETDIRSSMLYQDGIRQKYGGHSPQIHECQRSPIVL